MKCEALRRMVGLDCIMMYSAGFLVSLDERIVFGHRMNDVMCRYWREWGVEWSEDERKN